MQKHECRRCGFATSKLKDLKRHFDEKTPCEPILEDISRLVLKKELYSSNLPLHVQISKEIDEQIVQEEKIKQLNEEIKLQQENSEYKIYEKEPHYKIYSKDMSCFNN